VEQVWQSGLEAYAVDLTRPEIGLRTARVIIPESRHCWHRLANGRLYSTPVKLGWLPRALAEEELNPVPCPL
jgi:ribosomal protein S12 methylthiotransferase accessory factor